MKLQVYLTIATLILTAGYIALTIDQINWSSVNSIPSGSTQGFIGALIFGVTGLGLGWVNCAADYSRYLPRKVSGRAVVGWTVLAHQLFR